MSLITKNPCIYGLHNIINDKWYVGQTVKGLQRWYDHAAALARNSHKNNHLQRAWNTYGKDSFEFVVLEECQKEALTEREQFWMDTLEAYKEGYNNAAAANCPSGGKRTKEQCERIGQAVKRAWQEHPEKFHHGPRKVSQSHGRALTKEQAYEIRKRYAAGVPAISLAKEFSCHVSTVHLIRQGKMWTNLAQGEVPCQRKNVHLTKEQALNIRKRVLQGEAVKSLTTEFGCSRTTVYQIKTFKSWKGA